jgi:hypothetical protein
LPSDLPIALGEQGFQGGNTSLQLYSFGDLALHLEDVGGSAGSVGIKSTF